MNNSSKIVKCIATRFFISLKKMKIITAILAIYIFGLNFMPCNDNVADLEEQSGIHLTSSEDGHQDHEHSSDLCSPFCQCHCCHIHVIDVQLSEFKMITPEISTATFLLFENTGKEIQNRILQPPRHA